MLDKEQLGFKFSRELKAGLIGCFGFWWIAVLAKSEWSETVTINYLYNSFLKKVSYNLYPTSDPAKCTHFGLQLLFRE